MDFAKFLSEWPFTQGLLFVVLALFPIVNPLGMAPIFLEYTEPLDDKTTQRLALRVAIYSFFVAVGTLLLGSFVLKFFGLSLAAVQIGGGILLAIAGWRLLNEVPEDTSHRTPAASAEQIESGAFYPLTLPFTIGPGSIAVILTLDSTISDFFGSSRGVREGIGSIVGLAVLSVIIYLCYGYAEPILKRLGESGVNVVLRLTAFILLCIGVQIAITGLRTVLGIHAII
jgi:multiple antibiotic resistance protein